MSPEAAQAPAAAHRSGSIDTTRLLLAWAEAPWDTAIFGDPVLQIGTIEVRANGADADIAPYERSRDACGSNLVSCRLAHQQLRESMLLEARGFRFVEMVYQPELDDLDALPPLADNGLGVTAGTAADLPELLEIAGTAFRNERFHVDPRLPAHLGDLRYQNWVRSTLGHPRQRLHVLREGSDLVAFFVTELQADGTCYWHLNAVAPQAQGRGIGRRAWQAMVAMARSEGASRVRTSIVARNHRVLNLYARLGFSFPPPAMTFHWVRG